VADNLAVTTSPAAMLRHELQRDGARPFLTWYDDATGERVELSVATTANWAAKVANLLVDDFSLDDGDDVGVQLPAHWETAVVLLGAWTAGAAVTVGQPGWVTFRTPGVGAAPSDGRTVELSLGPMGVDFARVVAAQPDQFVAAMPVEGDARALAVGGRSWSHAELADAAVHGAAHHGLGPDSRVLSTLPFDTADGLDAGLLLPLAAGGSVVLVGSPDEAQLAARCTAERVTHTAGVTVAGVPRLDG
jgi:uncharacterized protein (TIGR03089 family)